MRRNDLYWSLQTSSGCGGDFCLSVASCDGSLCWILFIFLQLLVDPWRKMGGSESTSRNMSFRLDGEKNVTVIEGVKVDYTYYLYSTREVKSTF